MARNRITDLFRKKGPESLREAAVEGEDGEMLQIEDLLPSPDAGPEALYVRHVLLEEVEFALGELPAALLPRRAAAPADARPSGV